MLNENKKDKWIEVVTKRDGRSYTTAIRCSDITAIQKSVGDTVVDIHVSSDTIFTTVVTLTETNDIWNIVIGDEEE